MGCVRKTCSPACTEHTMPQVGPGPLWPAPVTMQAARRPLASACDPGLHPDRGWCFSAPGPGPAPAPGNARRPRGMHPLAGRAATPGLRGLFARRGGRAGFPAGMLLKRSSRRTRTADLATPPRRLSAFSLPAPSGALGRGAPGPGPLPRPASSRRREPRLPRSAASCAAPGSRCGPGTGWRLRSRRRSAWAGTAPGTQAARPRRAAAAAPPPLRSSRRRAGRCRRQKGRVEAFSSSPSAAAASMCE